MKKTRIGFGALRSEWRRRGTCRSIRRRSTGVINPPRGRARIGWEAEPVWVTPRLRANGRVTVRSQATAVVDQSQEKRELARLAADEAAQIACAAAPVGPRAPDASLDLGELETVTFRLLLDLLGEALATRTDPRQSVEAASMDGALQVRLGPADDGGRLAAACHVGWHTARTGLRSNDLVRTRSRDSRLRPGGDIAGGLECLKNRTIARFLRQKTLAPSPGPLGRARHKHQYAGARRASARHASAPEPTIAPPIAGRRDG